MAEQQQQQQSPAWRVTSQRETNRQDAMGRYVPGVLVSFQLRDGTLGSVWVPDAQYSAADLKSLITARVAVMEGVGALRG